MIYYKVSKEGDNRPIKFGNPNIFVGGELLTLKELDRLGADWERVEQYTTKVKISSRTTYFCFGVRFASKLNK